MSNMRQCDKCAHYVVKDEKINYEQNGCGICTQKIYGCELWDCEFKEKDFHIINNSEASK